MKLEIMLYEGTPCSGCKRKNRFPKYSCKDCKYAYSSNFKSVSSSPRHQKIAENKARRAMSDENLKHIYSMVKEMYFGGNYIPDPNSVLFTWKKGRHSRGGWCRKSTKEIKIGGLYKYAFGGQQDEQAQFLIRHFKDGNIRKRLIELMVHEAVHLRLAHHRKNFKNRVAEIQASITDNDVARIYCKEIK